MNKINLVLIHNKIVRLFYIPESFLMDINDFKSIGTYRLLNMKVILNQKSTNFLKIVFIMFYSLF